ncbi:MAG: EamA family transporter [Ignavibacteriaceae bacterium]|nr:EamA family transporter [Ignavibacteriaceae bacterium]
MWVIFALLNPFVDSTRNIFSKRASRNIDPILISLANNGIPMLIFSPVVFFVEFKFNAEFITALIISALINIAAVLLYHRALSKGEISEVVPMLSFTPLFLLLSSPLLVGEFPNIYGIIGIVLMVAGSYLLNINNVKGGLLNPLRSLVRNKGTRYMLIVAFIWSISANFDKIAITNSSIWQYAFSVNVLVTLGIGTIILIKRKFDIAQLRAEKFNLLMVGLFTSAGFYVHMTALSLTLVAYVIAFKRMGGLISVAYGGVFMGEKNIRRRFIGAMLMFLGVLFILLF